MLEILIDSPELYGDRAYLERIGRFVRDARLAKARTQESLAKDAGINRTTLLQMEKGQGCTLLSLIQVLRALDRLDVLRAFQEHEVVSPLMLAREEATKMRRAPRSKGKSSQPPLDW